MYLYWQANFFSREKVTQSTIKDFWNEIMKHIYIIIIITAMTIVDMWLWHQSKERASILHWLYIWMRLVLQTKNKGQLQYETYHSFICDKLRLHGLIKDNKSTFITHLITKGRYKHLSTMSSAINGLIVSPVIGSRKHSETFSIVCNFVSFLFNLVASYYHI